MATHFEGPAIYPLSDSPQDLRTGDVNGDGVLDAVVICGFSSESSQVFLYFGRGDGTFSGPATYSDLHKPRALSLADFNRDGADDIAVYGGGGDDYTLVILSWDGATGLQRLLAQPGGHYVREMEAADFNRDGRPDLVMGDTGEDRVKVMLGNGDGSFQNPLLIPIEYPSRLAVVDTNHDGCQDIITVDDAISDTVSVVLGNGDGTFQQSLEIKVEGIVAESVHPLDWDRDGNIDLVIPSRFDGVFMHRGMGDGRFQTPVLVMGLPAGNLSIGDITGEGWDDILLGSGGVQAVTWRISASNMLSGGIVLSPMDENLRTSRLADLNKDGRLDFLVLNGMPDAELYIWLNRKTPTRQGFYMTYPEWCSSGDKHIHEIPLGETITLQPWVTTDYSSNIDPVAGTAYVQLDLKSIRTITLPEGNDQSFDLNGLTAGFHNLTLRYSGSSSHLSGTSSSLQLAVKGTSVTSLKTEPVTSVYGMAAQGLITVSANTGVAPGGLVRVWLDGNYLTGEILDSQGTASFSLPQLPPGIYRLRAVYEGDFAHYYSFVDDISHTVEKAPTTCSVSVSATAVNAGEPVQVSSTVQAVPQTLGTPTGMVSYQNQSGTLSAASLSDGQHSGTLTLPAGTHLLSASYEGDSNFLGCTSSAVSVTVQSPLAVFSSAWGFARIAPDSLASAYGTGFADSAIAASDSLETELNGVTVNVRDSNSINREAQILFVSAQQVNFLVPSATALGLADVTVTSQTGVPSTGTVQVGQTSPGVFTANGTGQGPAAAYAVRQTMDGQRSVQYAFECQTGRGCLASPLEFGEPEDVRVLVSYGTGFRHASEVSAFIDGEPVSVHYAGAQSQFAGLDQINLDLPWTLAGRGEVIVTLLADGIVSNSVAVNLQ